MKMRVPLSSSTTRNDDTEITNEKKEIIRRNDRIVPEMSDSVNTQNPEKNPTSTMMHSCEFVIESFLRGEMGYFSFFEFTRDRAVPE